MIASCSPKIENRAPMMDASTAIMSPAKILALPSGSPLLIALAPGQILITSEKAT